MKPNTSIPVQELGKVEQLDPFRLEPGVILLDRFCLVGRVRHAARAWTVEVTDLTRELGQPPHHRAVLHHIPAEPEYTKSLQLALSAHRSLSPSILGVVLLDNGLGVLSDVPNGLPIEGPLSQSQTTSAAVTLVSLVSRLHSQGILGVRFDKSDLFIEGATVAVNGFRHLIPIANPTENTSKSVEHDIANLVGFLREIGGKHLHGVLNPGVENIDELWSRLRVMREDLPERRSDIDLLPPLPPFVGRDDGLRTLRDGLSVARIARASLFTITGEKGAGKTRLIEHYCASVSEAGAALILDGTFQASHNGTPTGLNAVIEQLPQRLQALSRRERNHIRQRIIEATGHQCGVLAGISPALNEFLGTTHPIPDLDLDEGFLRYAATVATALQAIGTEHRPLILVLDNAEWADPASIAVLEHLAFAKKPHHTQVILAARKEKGTAISNQSTRISLQPLDIDLVERFLGAVLPGPLPKARTTAHNLLDQSKGNPLNIWLTLQNWVQRGQLHLDEETGGWQFRAREAADPKVVELLRVRLDDLQGDAQWIALLVALQTGRSDHSWLTSITNWPKKRVSDATNSLIENAIIIEEPGDFLDLPMMEPEG